jgi:alkanesulfonate monooxygenase SsuD/methylene tetrahydromethanopterin reductase-like flavin-dependent oxidoreductase (luciferase family)
MLDIAGRLTDGTVTAYTGLKAVERQIIPGITKAAEAAGRPAPQVIVGLPVSVTNDVAAARAEISGMFSPGDLPAYKAMLDLEGVDSVADICVFGEEQQVAAQVRRFAEVGATEFSAFPVGDAATVARTIEVLVGI